MFASIVTIRDRDIDHMGHVNNAVYLQWVQRVVVDFWNEKAPDDAISKYVWIALEHTIKYYRPVFIKDDVRSQLVMDDLKGSKAFFTTSFFKGDKLLARAKSCWCALDAISHRPVRIPRHIVDHIVVGAKPADCRPAQGSPNHCRN